jgi:hypothetical protein
MRIEIVANENRPTELSFNDVKMYLSECIGVPVQHEYMERQLNGSYVVEYNTPDVLYMDESHTAFLRDGDRLIVPASLKLDTPYTYN